MVTRGSVADYVDRTIDIWAWQEDPASGDVLLQQTLSLDNEGGRIVTGVQKAAQRFLVELMRERGSNPFFPLEGNDFIIEARSGAWRTQSDVLGSFARASLQVRRLLTSEETDETPDDERIVSAAVTRITLVPGFASLQILITTVAGTDRKYIVPLTIVI